MGNLILRDVTYSYSSNRWKNEAAVKNVNLKLNDNKCCIVTGPCGSGKTTLSYLIKGLISPTAGEILLENKTIDLTSFRRSIGLVFQFPEEQFFNDTVIEEIEYGPLLLGLKDEDGRVKRSLEEVGLCYEKLREKSPFELSSGEQRRVAMASVIACEPSWYIFDEPTAGIDFEGRRRIAEIIKRIRKKKKTVIIITQELEEYLDICDEVLLLERGNLKYKFGVEDFLEAKNLGDTEFYLPYYNQILRILKSRGWDIPVSIIDPVKAAQIIVDMSK
jgi:energy-coupling factor transport system ATP-binding protein